MEMITVHTAQNIDIEYEVGGLGERIVARIIDYGIFIPIGVLASIVAPLLSKNGAIIFLVILSLSFVFYDLICEVFFNGQSFGKRIMKIRVISLDGGRPRFGQFLLRWIFRLIDFALGGGIVALVTAVMSNKSQRVGDIVAGTALVRTEPRTQRNKLLYVITPEDYEPMFHQAIEISDRDAALIHETINNYIQTGNNIPVYKLADKIRSHFSISMPPEMNSMQFLQTLLKDYSHIVSHAPVV